MPDILRVDLIAAGPRMPDVRFTDALPAVFTTVTLVIIEDEAGTVGIGAVESDSFGAFDLSPFEALRPILDTLPGRDSARPAVIRELVQSRIPSASRLLPGAAVEIACWDALGRRAELPLYQLLGGCRDEVTAYASLPFEAVLDTLLDHVQAVMRLGYGVVKLHLSGNPALDVSQVSEVRKVFPELVLMVDAESVYSRRDAAFVGRALDQLDIRWFEAPLPDRDIAGYAALTRSLCTPVIPAGGLVSDLRELGHVLRDSPWSAVRTQTMEGGVGYIAEVAALAQAFGLDLELTSYGTTITQAIDLHMILGLGIGSYYEQPFPSEPWDFGTTSPIRVKNGSVSAPIGPGLGMTLDMDSIDDAALARYSATR